MRLARDLGLPSARMKFWPRYGPTSELIVVVDHVVKMDRGKIFASPELAILYARRVSRDLYQWAVSKLPEISLKPGTIPDSVKDFWIGDPDPNVHYDQPTGVHFDFLIPATTGPLGGEEGHVDHDDHADHNDDI
jgi:hypothetical protein